MYMSISFLQIDMYFLYALVYNKCMTFSESLKNHLSSIGMSRAEFGRRVFNDQRALEQYFSSKSDPIASRLKLIAQYLNVSMDKAYNYDFEDPKSEFREDIVELAKIIEQLDDEDFYYVSEMIRVLAKKPKYAKKGDAESSVS